MRFESPGDPQARQGKAKLSKLVHKFKLALVFHHLPSVWSLVVVCLHREVRKYYEESYQIPSHCKAFIICTCWSFMRSACLLISSLSKLLGFLYRASLRILKAFLCLHRMNWFGLRVFYLPRVFLPSFISEDHVTILLNQRKVDATGTLTNYLLAGKIGKHNHCSRPQQCHES